MPVIVPLALIIGYFAGVLVNLIADYLPARRHYILASSNPFVSREVIPAKPSFLPRDKQGHLLSLPVWSGIIAAFTKRSIDRHQSRRVIVELGLALVFALIAWQFYYLPNLPFMLFYASVLVLIAIIDIEHRWVFLEIIIPAGLIALVEASYSTRVWLDDSLRGGLYGFGIMLGLYFLGIGFAFLVRIITGRPVGRTVLGIGDVYIGTMGGLIIGASTLGFALLIMVITGAIAALAVIVNRWRKTRRYRKFSAIPYGPYIVLGIAAMLYIPHIVKDVVTRIVWGW